MTVQTEYRQAKRAATRSKAESAPMTAIRQTAAQGRLSGIREGKTANGSQQVHSAVAARRHRFDAVHIDDSTNIKEVYPKCQE